MKYELQTGGYMGPDDEDWQHLGFTSQDLLHIERRVPGFTANSFFGEVTIGRFYQAAYYTLKRHGKLPEGLTMAQFEETYFLHLNSPEELAMRQAALMAGLGAPQPEDAPGEVDPTPPTA